MGKINAFFRNYFATNNILYLGSTAGGHYVALCKHPVSKKWHEFNDNMYVKGNNLINKTFYFYALFQRQ